MDLLTLRLNDGREIRLERLVQCKTYAGLLVGSPNDKLNNWTLNGIRREAEAVMPASPVVIIDPEIKALDDGSEEFPPIVCIGYFTSVASAPGGVKMSDLTLVWFEDTIERTISQRNLEAIQDLNWNRRASEFDIS